MRLLAYLQEEYIGRVNVKNKYVQGTTEVFLFPSRKELSQYDEVRLIIDLKNEKFYVWDANSKVFHGPVSDHFNIPLQSIEGIGAVKGGKITFDRYVGQELWCPYQIRKNIDKYFKEAFLKKVMKYFTFGTKEAFYSTLRRA